jgi:hypothetical protein
MLNGYFLTVLTIENMTAISPLHDVQAFLDSQCRLPEHAGILPIRQAPAAFSD